MDLHPILQGLNPQQKKAVKTIDGPLLISAGAGSGKTRVLTHRIAWILKNKKSEAHQILALTFTNKAAKEMLTRLHDLCKSLDVPGWWGMWVSTFHSACAKILKENKGLLHNTSVFTIYDTNDKLSLIKKIMRDMNISDKMINPKAVSASISLCKHKALGPLDINEDNYPAFGNRFQEIYVQYEEELKKAGGYDFESLLFETYKLFLRFPEHLERYRKRFLYISVDEYQDTNHIQYLIVKLLAQNHRNICVVGDDDQSIYSWRGAEISNILNFDRDFPECVSLKLEQNYRSTKHIIKAASHLIENNMKRSNKRIFTDNPQGVPIQIFELENEHDEARQIASIISQNCRNDDYSFSDFSIFYRTNAQSRVLEDAMRSQSIPYQVVGNLRFYDRAEIKDIFAYMKFIANARDEVALKRIINVPRRGIGGQTLSRIDQEVRLSNKSFYETLCSLSKAQAFRLHTNNAINSFIKVIEYLKGLEGTVSLKEFYKALLEKTGYSKNLKDEDTVESLSRLENLQELANVIDQYEKEHEDSSLSGFLEEMALQNPEGGEDSEADKGVTLMTLHVSKGLEFNNVFIVGFEEGLFPLPDSGNPFHLEEERRLAYVGMTRAKKELFLSYALTRHKFGQIQYNKPSQFLGEIPKPCSQFHSFKKKQRVPFMNRGSANKEFFSQSVTNAADNATTYNVGMPIRHPKFGEGIVHKIEGKGENMRISVLFHENRTIKKFLARYAKLYV